MVNSFDEYQGYEYGDKLKKMAAEHAADFIRSGMIVGLGSGTTMSFLFDKLQVMVKKGLDIRVVATTDETEKRMREIGVKVLNINEVTHIDLAIDGVDEIDHNFNATKGGNGCLFREKIIASLADVLVWILDESKYVYQLGECPLPVEILPYGYQVTFAKLRMCGFNPVMRMRKGELFVTDNGNYIADLHLEMPVDVDSVRDMLKLIVGVLETGQYLRMGDCLVVGTSEGVRVVEKKYF